MPDVLKNSKEVSVTGAERERRSVVGELCLIFGVGHPLEGFNYSPWLLS